MQRYTEEQREAISLKYLCYFNNFVIQFSGFLQLSQPISHSIVKIILCEFVGYLVVKYPHQLFVRDLIIEMLYEAFHSFNEKFQQANT